MSTCKVTFGFKGNIHKDGLEESITFASLNAGAIAAMKIAHVLGLHPCTDMGVSKKNPKRRIESITHFVEVSYL